ncbi:CxxxxCH/CxxCH domain-containing protein, partial [Geobacter sp. OR-1]|uniref:CxxxxCH/CxxCH domain c-type cytochrome n=1 Tax=Geobacter sp. OR-1 TaxID=1266765 RepID=UPI0005A608C7
DYSGVRAGRSYNVTDGICSNVYCHSDGKGRQNAPFTAGTGWNSAAVYSDCKQCHGNDEQFGHYSTHAGEPNYANAGYTDLRANSHKKHTKSGAVTCSNCHSETTLTGTAIKADSTTHINGVRNIVQNGTTAQFAWDNGVNRTCSNINCHFGNSATWGDTLTCDSCHGNDE